MRHVGALERGLRPGVDGCLSTRTTYDQFSFSKGAMDLALVTFAVEKRIVGPKQVEEVAVADGPARRRGSGREARTKGCTLILLKHHCETVNARPVQSLPQRQGLPVHVARIGNHVARFIVSVPTGSSPVSPTPADRASWSLRSRWLLDVDDHLRPIWHIPQPLVVGAVQPVVLRNRKDYRVLDGVVSTQYARGQKSREKYAMRANAPNQ